MKQPLLALVAVAMLSGASAQNLIPNGDFEQLAGCPTYISQIDSAAYWFNPTLGIGPHLGEIGRAHV